MMDKAATDMGQYLKKEENSPVDMLKQLMDNFALFDTAQNGGKADGKIGIGDLKAMAKEGPTEGLRDLAQQILDSKPMQNLMNQLGEAGDKLFTKNEVMDALDQYCSRIQCLHVQ